MGSYFFFVGKEFVNLRIRFTQLILGVEQLVRQIIRSARVLSHVDKVDCGLLQDLVVLVVEPTLK